MRKAFAFVCLAAAAGTVCAKEPIDYVNPSIGTISHMLVPAFPTIQLPNGMLRVTPPNESFTTDLITGFCLSVPSHRQSPVFQMMPFSGDVSAARPGWHSHYDHADARPYRYSVFLDDFDVTVDLAPGRQSAIYAVTFESGPSHMLFFRPRQKGALTVSGNTLSGTDEIRGVTVYVYATFDTDPARVGAFEGKTLRFAQSAVGDTQRPVALEFAPSAKTVRMRYGISYLSVEQAKRNLEEEISDYDLEGLAKKARAAWNTTLGAAEVEGGTENEKTVFYTALYRCHERMVRISEDGRYFSAWDKKVHADDGIPFWTDDWTWDTYRAFHPLMTILHPSEQAEKLTSYIRMCEQSGWMPTFPTLSGDMHAMNGQHATSLFLDAWRKGIRSFDLAKAYEGAKKTALEESIIPWHRGPATELDRFFAEHGYFPALKPGETETVPEVTQGERRQSVAVTLAAAYDAWCLAELAHELGKTEDEAFFRARSLCYRNLWKPDTAFFHPKDKDGRWILPFDYIYSGGQAARDYYDENNAWTYLWDVPHNVADLVALFGSREAFAAKLDSLFSVPYGKARWEFYNQFPDSTGTVGMFVMGNEPSFHIPYLYNFIGQPWKTQKRVRMLMEAWFRNDLMGLCGDEDGGGMSAFAVFSSMGFYPPTPGNPVYTFGSPLFSQVTLRLENGKRFTIRAPRADHENKYIQSVTVNGQPWEKTWFTHDLITSGGTVVIDLGPRPDKQWGTAPDAAPPSEGLSAASR